MGPPGQSARPALALGQRLGPYSVEALLGAGGMGEVYRARDTRLDRDVAIKVLPQVFTADADRLARFEREARVLAALNHPNIAAIHGFEESAGLRALVLEFVDGRTLADVIAHGPVPFPEAATIARQICEALEAAHEQGIVHRDLKPSNIKLRPDGTVKVLDFGLAKALEPATGADPTGTPTITTPAVTQMGVILGTAAYMSPEQAKGRPADKRSDIFSFGCVLYEMLTGRRAFEGESVSETLAALLRGEPDWAALRPDTPSAIRRLLRRCLEKDPRRRMADINDVRAAIEDAGEDGLPAAAPNAGPGLGVATRTRVGRMMTAVLLALLVVTSGTSVWLAWRASHSAPTAQRFAIAIEEGRQVADGPSLVVACSPDGRRLVYVARAGGRTRLFLREFDQYDGVAVDGTEGASAPFFSPDGEWVGFFARNALQKVTLRGGAPLKIADAPSVVSASWGRDGSIVFATALAGDGLWQVSSDGGTPEPLTRVNAAGDELQHAYPQVLPGEERVLFTVVGATSSSVAILATATRRWQPVPQVQFESGGAQYVPTGHLLYAQAGRLVAVPFDLRRAVPSGPSFVLRELVDNGAQSAGRFAVASAGTGSLAYVPRRSIVASDSLVLVDREGRSSPIVQARSIYSEPRFSHDGQRLAVTVEGDAGRDVWIFDLRRKTRTRLTSGGASESPAWSPDGRFVAFHAPRPGPWTLYQRTADGSASSEPLLAHPPQERSVVGAPNLGGLLPGTLPSLSGAHPQFPASWTSDGLTLAFTERKPSGERDIWVVTRGSSPVPFLVTPSDESSPAFSPDGRFLAYVSDENGQNEVYVQSYPGPGGRWLISVEGGSDPVWTSDGRELIYRRGDSLIAVGVQTRPDFSVGSQMRVFEGGRGLAADGRNYDISPDGRHFVMIRSEAPPSAPRLNVVLHWFDDLRRSSPAQ